MYVNDHLRFVFLIGDKHQHNDKSIIDPKGVLLPEKCTVTFNFKNDPLRRLGIARVWVEKRLFWAELLDKDRMYLRCPLLPCFGGTVHESVTLRGIQRISSCELKEIGLCRETTDDRVLPLSLQAQGFYTKKHLEKVVDPSQRRLILEQAYGIIPRKEPSHGEASENDRPREAHHPYQGIAQRRLT